MKFKFKREFNKNQKQNNSKAWKEDCKRARLILHGLLSDERKEKEIKILMGVN